MSKGAEITQAHCNQCHVNTYQDVLAAESWTDADGEEMPWLDLYELLRCRGCRSVSMRHTYTYDNPEAGRPTVVQYPAPVARRAPDWIVLSELGASQQSELSGVPDTVCGLLTEVYTALQGNGRRLAAMGVRAVLEAVMIDKVGDKGSFAKSLDAFQQAGYVSIRQRNVLETILDAGHASIHRGWEPTNDDVTTLVDIVESVVESAYIHEDRASRLEKAVPKRSRPSAPPAKK